MANYSLVINSKFQPFSFERYMQPVMQYAQLYETQQAALDTLLEKSSEWERLANMSGSKESYNKYKSYSEDLRKAADELATKGLTPNSRGDLTRLRKGYYDNIRPIERAYERWQELEKEQRIFNASNNFNVRYDNDFTNGINLDDLVKNPMMSYTAIKGDDVMTRTSALAKQALQSIMDDPEVSEATKGLLKIKMQNGATLEELNRALQMGLEPGQTGDKAVDALLQVARTVNESYKGNPAYDQDFMWRNISQGLYGGVGTTTYNVMQDPMALNPLEQYQLDVTKESNKPVRMENGVYYDKVHSMYYKVGDDGKRTYYSYDPNLYNPNNESVLSPDQATNLSAGDIIPSTDGTAPSIVTKKDSKTGAASVSKLKEVDGHPGVYTDGKGHFYTADGKLTQNPFSGSGSGATEKAPSAPNYTPINFKGRSIKSPNMQDKKDSGYYWGLIGGSGRMQDDDIETALKNKSVVLRVKKYIGQVLNVDSSTITDEVAKTAVRNRLIDICRDRDWFSNDEFQIRMNGVLKDGQVRRGEDTDVKSRKNDLWNLVKGTSTVSGTSGNAEDDDDLPN